MLSNCLRCIHYSPNGCSVNPGYLEAVKLLEGQEEIKNKIDIALARCEFFDRVESLTLRISLPSHWWSLAFHKNCPPGLGAAIAQELEQQIGLALQDIGEPPFQLPEIDENPFE